MRQTNDGFLIAEKDLELRGPGELLGTRQTGLAAFRVADLARDAGLLPQVHALADRLLDTDPALADRLIARWIGGAARYASARGEQRAGRGESRPTILAVASLVPRSSLLVAGYVRLGDRSMRAPGA
jgi:ATP-dependent DNA helicase RecG